MKDALIAASIGFVFGIALMALGNWGMYVQCKNNVTEMGKEFKYDIINGCRVSIGDGKFVYWKMYRYNE